MRYKDAMETDKKPRTEETTRQTPADPSQDGETREKSSPPDKETGGRDGPDPTRFGDWEKNGRCIDF